MKIQLNKSFFITVALLIATATLAHYSALWRMKGTARAMMTLQPRKNHSTGSRR